MIFNPSHTESFYQRFGGPLIVLLIAVFLLVGSFGHDPWKIDDATHFGVIWRALLDGNAVQFTLTGDSTPLPPLYYWLGGLAGATLGQSVSLPDAIRAATPIFAALTGFFLWLSVRSAAYGPDARLPLAAPLALVGSLGFLVHGHETQPLLAVTASLAMTLAGAASAHVHPLRAMLLLGFGLGGLFLAGGLTWAPTVALLALASLAFSATRARALLTLLAALLVAAALTTPWLLSLHADGAAWAKWWSFQSSQFSLDRGSLITAADYGRLLPWFAWPAFPLACWALWTGRRRIGTASMALPLVGFLALWVNLSLLDESRNANAVLLLVPLSLLAPMGVSALRRGAASAFDWFGRMTFTFAAALIWLGWYAMAFGLPAQIARNFARLGPGFTMPVLTLPVLVAVGASVLWLYLTFRSTRYPLRPLAHWCGGMTLLWALVMTLWLPWVEHVKSYRSVAQKIATHLPRSSDTGCVSGHRLGAPQQASLEYFLDRRLRTLSAARPCNFVITQGGRQENALPGSWTKRWEGARPGDRHERFRLYSRNEPAAAQ